jgi:hypothetical protein
MPGNSQVNFIRQQGFQGAGASECESRFPGLMFQPRIVGLVVAIAIIFQAAYLFLALAAVLWWSALVPARNPFEALYNALIARPRNLPPLQAAPAPRRFAQGMAGTFALAIGLSLLAGLRPLAWTLEVLLVIALAALLFGRLCVGSYLFHILTRNRAFANRTLPWSKISTDR